MKIKNGNILQNLLKIIVLIASLKCIKTRTKSTYNFEIGT